MKYYKNWWINSNTIIYRKKSVVVTLFFIYTVLFNLFFLYKEYMIFNNLNNSYMISLLVTSIINIAIAILIFRFQSKDIRLSCLMILIISISNFVFFLKLLFASIRYNLPLYPFLIIIYLLFFILSKRKIKVKEVYVKYSKLVDRIFITSMLISFVFKGINEFIRVKVFYTQHSGFAFTSNSTSRYLIYIYLLIPLVIFIFFLKSKPKIYQIVTIVYLFAYSMFFLMIDILNYLLSLRRFFGDNQPFVFMELIESLYNFFDMRLFIVLAVLKIISFKKVQEKKENLTMDNIVLQLDQKNI